MLINVKFDVNLLNFTTLVELIEFYEFNKFFNKSMENLNDFIRSLHLDGLCQSDQLFDIRP